jgi:GDPmannose 4,6-dehydratase
MKRDKVLITGVTGQDGALLAEMLLNLDKDVFGTFRKTSGSNFWRLQELGILDEINLVQYQVGQSEELAEAMKQNHFSQIYHLCGDSMAASSLIHPYQTMNTNVQGLIEVLECVRKVSKETRIFVAASSEVFDTSELNDKSNFMVDENYRKKPRNPYGVASLSNMALVEVYRDQFNLKISLGIMFNHESNLRGDLFVSKKITKGLARIKYSGGKPLQIGNFDSCRDWSSATDFIAAMHLMLNSQLYDNFVLASGKIHKVRDILKIASQVLGYDASFEGEGPNEVMVDSKSGKTLVQVAQKFHRKFDEYSISGNTSKFLKISGWSPKVTFEELISNMAKFDAEKSWRSYSRRN